MKSHKERMSEISFWAIPRKDAKDRPAFEEFMKKQNEDPKIRQEAENRARSGYSLFYVQQNNGLGLPADSLLRGFNAEYNNRVIKHSLHDLPSSFNVMEAFNSFIPAFASFKIPKEIDHIFPFIDFIDFVTSDSSNESSGDITEIIDEGAIYSYNSNSDPLLIDFSTLNGEKFVFSAVSLIRFGNEISMALLAGQICDLQSKTEEIKKSFNPSESTSRRPYITEDTSTEVKAEPLEKDKNLWRTIVLTRFDLKSKTIDVRYVLQDWGRLYNVKSDDIASYLEQDGKFINEKFKSAFEKSSKNIDEYQALFELCKTCLFLPAFFKNREEDIRVERHPTKLLEIRKKHKFKKIDNLVDKKFKLAYREVYGIPASLKRTPDRSTFSAPSYKIETSGYWKKLPIQTEGRDKNGNPIQGRTWVNQTLSWIEDNNETSLTFDKNVIHPKPLNGGYIYVMRSAAHDKDLFKIGLTRRTSEIRAAELSKSTSSPDHFLVVQEWFVSDCVLAEKLIHEKLASLRVNPKREYFKARYSVIVNAINDVISSIELADQNKG